MEDAFMNRKAFTITELLVIVAAVSILAAILFPVFAQSGASQRERDTLRDPRKVGEAVLMYTGDNDGVFPPGCGDGWWGPTDGNWALDIEAYVRKHTSLVVPEDPQSKATWPTWLVSEPGAVNISFVANGFIKFDGSAYGVYGLMGLNASWMDKGVTSESQVTHPHSTVMLTEAFGLNPLYGPSDFLSGVTWWDFVGTGGLIPDPTRDGSPYFVNGVEYSADNRNGGVNSVTNVREKTPFVWADGHASQERPISTNPNGADDAHNRWDASR